MSRRTPVLDHPGLFDLEEPQPEPTPQERPPSRRRHVLGLPKPWYPVPCYPTCLRCGRPEGEGMCTPACAIVCGRPEPTDRKKRKMPVEVCLITTRVTAVLVTGVPTLAKTRHLALVLCPHCGDVHHHAAAYGTHYRLSTCGQPYIVHLPRPRITNGAP